MLGVPLLAWTLESLSLSNITEVIIFCTAHADAIREYVAYVPSPCSTTKLLTEFTQLLAIQQNTQRPMRIRLALPLRRGRPEKVGFHADHQPKGFVFAATFPDRGQRGFERDCQAASGIEEC